MPILWFLIKTYILVFALVWVRLSLPRLQVDQLMSFAWKILIPLGLVNIGVVAAIILWAPQWKLALAAYGWVALLAVRRPVRPGPALAAAPPARAPAQGDRGRRRHRSSAAVSE